MATSKIMTNNSITETLATDVYLERIGNIRILRLKSAVYSAVRTVTLPESDRPSKDTEFVGLKHYNGAYDTMGVGYVRTTGKIECSHFANYNGTAYMVALTDTDSFIGQAIWSV